MRLTSKLVILLITAVFVPIVLISSVIIRQHQHAYTQALLEQEKELAIRLANDIDHFLAKKRDMLKLAGSAFFLQHMARLEVDFLLALLLKSDSEIHWVAILDTQGQELTRMSRTEAVLRDDLIDRSADTWFQTALHGTAVTSPVFFAATNEPYVRLYIPVPLYPYSDTCRTCSSITKVYGCVKNHFPLSLAPGKPRFYVCKFTQHTKVTL